MTPSPTTRPSSPLKQKPDAVVFHTTELWGQFPLNWDNKTPRNLSGVLTVNRSAPWWSAAPSPSRARRTTCYPAPTRRRWPSRPQRCPHHDGLRLAIIDPDPLNATPLTPDLCHAQRPGIQRADQSTDGWTAEQGRGRSRQSHRRGFRPPAGGYLQLRHARWPLAPSC